jgi:hypothetical protein
MRFLRGQRLGSPTPFVLRQCALTALFAVSNVAALNAAEAAKDPEFGWREMWVGADASKNAWLIYTGVTLAPFSKDIYSDGLRLRLSSGYGKYNYRISRSPDRPKCPAGKDQIVKPCIDVDVGISYVDALVGYQMRFGELTAKAFAGISRLAENLAALVRSSSGSISARTLGQHSISVTQRRTKPVLHAGEPDGASFQHFLLAQKRGSIAMNKLAPHGLAVSRAMSGSAAKSRPQ